MTYRILNLVSGAWVLSHTEEAASRRALMAAMRHEKAEPGPEDRYREKRERGKWSGKVKVTR